MYLRAIRASDFQVVALKLSNRATWLRAIFKISLDVALRKKQQRQTVLIAIAVRDLPVRVRLTAIHSAERSHIGSAQIVTTNRGERRNIRVPQRRAVNRVVD